jgi:CheY-like chemotaxis protein
MKKKDSRIVILMAEDDPDDRLLSKEALIEAHLVNELRFVEDGEQLMDYLLQRGQFETPKKAPRPGLILLDLNMPKMDGREALREIKNTPSLRSIPIVVLTTSKAEEDVIRSYELGVSGYITKPVSLHQLVRVMETINQYWFEIVQLPPYHDSYSSDLPEL